MRACLLVCVHMYMFACVCARVLDYDYVCTCLRACVRTCLRDLSLLVHELYVRAVLGTIARSILGSSPGFECSWVISGGFHYETPLVIYCAFERCCGVHSALIAALGSVAVASNRRHR